MKIAIVDYGVGNLFSLQSSFAAIGADASATGDGEVIAGAERIVLPGVGAFGDAADKLRRSGLDRVVKAAAERGTPLLGICLGMQLLLEKSFEYGVHDGLGLIPGAVLPIRDVIPPDYKIPHIGWNALDFTSAGEHCPLLGRVRPGEYVYFVHSYYAARCGESVMATADYGAPLTACIRRDNVYGCQFHPEKSGGMGLNILRAFCYDC